MTSGDIGYQPADERSIRPGQQQRWYTWQSSLRNQPQLIRFMTQVHRTLKFSGGVDLVPLSWLRLPLKNVGCSDQVGYADIQALAELVTIGLQGLKPAAVELSQFAIIGNTLALEINEHAILDSIRRVIQTCIMEIPGLKAIEAEADSAYQYFVPIAIAESSNSGERAAREIMSSPDLARQVIRIPILGVSQVLLNRESFKTETWTELHKVNLEGVAYPG